jgi:hypothetical protein
VVRAAGSAAVAGLTVLGPSARVAAAASGDAPAMSHYVVPGGDARAADAAGYRSGCVDGRAGRPGLRVLFYGTQEADGKLRPPGTTEASPAARFAEEWVQRNAEGWIRGFTQCGGVDAVLALGVNNKSDGKADPARAGAAWAALVERVAATTPANRVVVAGALDGEPSWSPPRWARSWVDSYVRGTHRRLYAADSADGCPETTATQACAHGWTVADVYHVATGAASTVLALPQIYRTDGIQARQWAAIDAWATRSGLAPLRIVGVLSQRSACRQKGGCARTANSPEEALRQLSEALGGSRAGTLMVTDVDWTPGDADPNQAAAG